MRNNSSKEKAAKNNEKKIQPQIIGVPKQKTRITGTNTIKSIIIKTVAELKKYHSPKISRFPEH